MVLHVHVVRKPQLGKANPKHIDFQYILHVHTYNCAMIMHVFFLALHVPTANRMQGISTKM